MNETENTTLASARAPCRVCLAGEDLDWTIGPSVLLAASLKISVAVGPPNPSAPQEVSISSSRPWPAQKAVSWSNIRKLEGHYLDSVQACLVALCDFGIGVGPCNVVIDSEFPARAGLSSSAAVIVSALSAFSAFFGATLAPTAICQLAYYVEHDILRTGAGQMDFYPCAIGGLMYIDSASSPPLVEPMQLPAEIGLVIVDTRTPRKTAEVIEWKRQRLREADKLLHRYLELTYNAVQLMYASLKESPRNWKEVGELMSCCHSYLRDYLCVSTCLLDNCVDICRRAGAYGAKLTGTGKGGCLFALTPMDAIPGIKKSLQSLPVDVYVTRPSRCGVTSEIRSGVGIQHAGG
jgi:mevalonate kinase